MKIPDPDSRSPDEEAGKPKRLGRGRAMLYCPSCERLTMQRWYGGPTATDFHCCACHTVEMWRREGDKPWDVTTGRFPPPAGGCDPQEPKTF